MKNKTQKNSIEKGKTENSFIGGKIMSKRSYESREKNKKKILNLDVQILKIWNFPSRP